MSLIYLFSETSCRIRLHHAGLTYLFGNHPATHDRKGPAVLEDCVCYTIDEERSAESHDESVGWPLVRTKGTQEIA
jgi:hypothetical protein